MVQRRTRPFRLHKSWVNEGGISSPLIVHWPNGIKDQKQTASRSVSLRRCPADAGGPGRRGAAANRPPADRRWPAGGSCPRSTKTTRRPHEFLYFNHSNNRAIRVGDWKLVATGKGTLGIIRPEQGPLRATGSGGGASRPRAKAGRDVDRTGRRVRPGARERRQLQNGSECGFRPRATRWDRRLRLSTLHRLDRGWLIRIELAAELLGPCLHAGGDIGVLVDDVGGLVGVVLHVEEGERKVVFAVATW